MAAYYVWSGATGAGTGADWANAFTNLTAAFVTEVAGDTLYVAHDHAETTAAAITLTSSGVVANPTKVVCVNRSGSVPPVSVDRRATAQVTTTGSSSINFNGTTHYDGLIFVAGNNLVLHLSTSAQALRFDNCSLRLPAGTAPKIFCGNSIGGSYVEWNNTTAFFSNVSQSIENTTIMKWRNTPSALLGSIPNFLFIPVVAQRGASLECIGVDLSAAGSGKTIVAANAAVVANTSKFIDCKLDAAVTKSVVSTALGSTEIDFVRSGASGVNYTVHRHRIPGLLTEETAIVRTGGASDGTTSIAWKIVTTANCTYSIPFECPPIAIWNDIVGSSVTATVEGIWGGGAVPLDNEIWLECEYLGDAASPQGSFINDGTPDLLTTPANQTTSTATWGGSTTKFKLNVTFTPQQKGWIYARVKCAKASSTFYIDPLVTLS